MPTSLESGVIIPATQVIDYSSFIYNNILSAELDDYTVWYQLSTQPICMEQQVYKRSHRLTELNMQTTKQREIRSRAVNKKKSLFK